MCEAGRGSVGLWMALHISESGSCALSDEERLIVAKNSLSAMKISDGMNQMVSAWYQVKRHPNRPSEKQQAIVREFFGRLSAKCC